MSLNRIDIKISRQMMIGGLCVPLQLGSVAI